MKWVSMAEEPHTTLRSPCAIPSFGWSDVKFTAIWTLEQLKCILWWWITLYHLAVWRKNLGLADARRTLCPLVPVKGNLNATAYNNSVFPPLWQQFGEGPFIFQHDNAPVYKARSIQKWFVEIGVEELDWPAQSPDLNPIDNLWDELERRLRARLNFPTSVPDLTNALVAE